MRGAVKAERRTTPRSLPAGGALVGRADAVAALAVLVAVLSVCVAACGASEDDDAPQVAVSSEETAARAGAEGDATAAPAPAAERLGPDGAPLLPIPPRRQVEHGASGATITREGGVIVAGEMRLEIRAGAVSEPTVVQIESLDPEDMGRELPAGLILAAGRGTPPAPDFRPVARWVIPTVHEVEPRMEVDVLAWNAGVGSWITLGRAQANAEGTAIVFLTTMLGEVVVRARPVWSADRLERCPGETFNLGEQWPTDEGNAVGYTPQTERTRRTDAFTYLTDFRLSPWLDLVDVKNEEVVDLAGRRNVDERNHKDEDYLMDPNLAAAVAMLARLVRDEWYDPYTGEPTIRLRLTEAYDSVIEHQVVSTHYQGRSADLTLSPLPAPEAVARRAFYGRMTRMCVCAGFDYAYFENRFHAHSAVLATQVAALVDLPGGAQGVRYGKVFEPGRWVSHPHTWDRADFDGERIAWEGPGVIRVVGREAGASGPGMMALYLNSARVEVAPAEDAALPPTRSRTVDGLRELRVVDGTLYLVNTAGLPSPGSSDARGTPVDFAYPAVLDDGPGRVRSATFLRHPRTEEAWEALGMAAAERAEMGNGASGAVERGR